MIKALVGLVIANLGAPFLTAAELRPETLKAWDAYIAATELQMQARLNGQRSFLWADESRDRDRRLRQGEIVVEPVAANGVQAVPHALIHHWIGAVFIPNASPADLFRVLHAYSCYKQFYKPFVADSKLLASAEATQEFLMIFQYHMVLATVAIEARYQKHDFILSTAKGYSVANATQIQEIESYGRSGERRLPPGTGAGLLWRTSSIARYEERHGGLYLELEALALTRDIPPALHWMICPMVKHVAINSLSSTLQKTRDGVMALPQSVETCQLCTNSPRSARLEGSARK